MLRVLVKMSPSKLHSIENILKQISGKKLDIYVAKWGVSYLLHVQKELKT